MTTYHLRNGIIVDSVKWKIAINSGDSAKFIEENKVNIGKVDFHTGTHIIDADGNKSATPGFSATADITIRNATEKLLAENSVGVIQTTQTDFQKYFYPGQRREGCGSTKIELINKALTPLLDCVVILDKTKGFMVAPTKPFYQFPQVTTTSLLNGYRVVHEDAPGENIPLARHNPSNGVNTDADIKSGKWNYLRDYSVAVKFIACLIFIHKDGTKEAIEGWKWSNSRELKVIWRNDRPVFRLETNVMQVDPEPTNIFGANSSFLGPIIADGSVGNIVLNAALENSDRNENITVRNFQDNQNFDPGFYLP